LELKAVKTIASVLFAGLLAGAVFAQGTPPADPPKDPPKDGDPKPPDAPPEIPHTTNWEKDWQGARNVAQKKNGYALMFVTQDPKKNGDDGPHTSRLLNQFFGVAETFQELNDQYGCWKGTYAEAKVAGGKHLADAGVEAGPAVIFVDPESGEVVDSYVGNCTYMEVTDIIHAIRNGNHRKGLEKKLAEAGNKNDPILNFLYGESLLRAGELKDARKHYEIGKTANANAGGMDRRAKFESIVGLVWCDFKEKKYKEAIEGAQKAMDEMPEMVPPRGTCLYIQMWSYYHQNEFDECAKIAQEIRLKYIRDTFGRKMIDDMVDIGYNFITKQKWTPGEAAPPETSPEEPK
jgi:hypothetical protein